MIRGGTANGDTPFGLRFGERGRHVEIERIAGRAGLLRAIEHGEVRTRLRQRGEERAARERAIQPDLQDADLLAAGDEMRPPSRARFRRPIP